MYLGSCMDSSRLNWTTPFVQLSKCRESRKDEERLEVRDVDSEREYLGRGIEVVDMEGRVRVALLE